jgi:hypothetical protein
LFQDLKKCTVYNDWNIFNCTRLQQYIKW